MTYTKAHEENVYWGLSEREPIYGFEGGHDIEVVNLGSGTWQAVSSTVTSVGAFATVENISSGLQTWGRTLTSVTPGQLVQYDPNTQFWSPVSITLSIVDSNEGGFGVFQYNPEGTQPHIITKKNWCQDCPITVKCEHFDYNYNHSAVIVKSDVEQLCRETIGYNDEEHRQGFCYKRYEMLMTTKLPNESFTEEEQDLIDQFMLGINGTDLKIIL